MSSRRASVQPAGALTARALLSGRRIALPPSPLPSSNQKHQAAHVYFSHTHQVRACACRWRPECRNPGEEAARCAACLAGNLQASSCSGLVLLVNVSALLVLQPQTWNANGGPCPRTDWPH